MSLYADDMFTSGILEKGAMPLKILEPSGSNVIRYEIESAVVYIKGIRRARGGFTTSTQAVSFERLFANILRLNVEKGTFGWRVAEVRRDGDSLVNVDNGEIYPARSGDYYDLIPYLVHVPAGATAITYDMVEDLRADERYCGYVRDRLAPEKVSELENDAGYATEDQIENVITTEPQELTDAEKAQARANIGAAAAGEGGSGGGTVAGAPKNVWYGTGAKAGSSSQFINVTTAGGDFVLADGNMVYVKLTSKIGVVSNVSLNVDGTGSIDTDIGGAQWCDNEIVGFVYSESKFLKIDAGTATTQKIGKVLLSSSLSSDSMITAATSSAVKHVYTYVKSIGDVLDGKVDQARTEAAEAKTLAENAQPKGDYALRSELPEVPVQSVNGKTGAVQLLAGDVGAEAIGTADSKVSSHNTSDAAHNDIRLLISGLTTRLNTLANSTDTDLDQLAEIVAYIKSNKSLIDSITTSKVNVEDIIDNLTTSVSNKPLSAKMGVQLKSLIDAIKIPTTLPASDVYSWAKQPNKPTYTASEVGAATVKQLDDLRAYIDNEILGGAW